MSDSPLPMTGPSLARALLRAGAVTVRPVAPFTWASGLRAPVYCDNRLTLAQPALRSAIAEALAAEARAWSPEAIAAVATAGIPQGTLVADRLGLPLAYVRAAPKAHGHGRRVEGRLAPGQRVVLVEDLVSTGGSALAAAEALRAEGAEVAAVVCVFAYGLPEAETAFTAAGLPLRALAALADLLEAAEADGALEPAARAALEAWRRDPRGWSDRATAGEPATSRGE